MQSHLFKNSHRPNDSRQTRLKISLYFSVCYKSRVLLFFFFFLHLCKCPDSIHLGFVFTVSLQDQGRFLLLRREPGQEGSASPSPGWTQPGAGSTGLYPSPRLLRLCSHSPRGCPSLPTLISVFKGREGEPKGPRPARCLGRARQPLPSPGCSEGLGQGCCPAWTTMGLGQGGPGCTRSPCGDLGL